MRLLSRFFILPAILVLLLLLGCTSHPVVSPEPLKPGESYQGIALSAENVVPQVVYRRGLSPRMDAGLRLGLLPIHGSGADMSLLILDEGKRVHTLNTALTYAEQSSLEFSYINAKRKERSSTVRRDGKVYKRIEKNVFNYGYFGLRYAYIPEGLYGDNKHRFGFLYGQNFKREWGFEAGYLHEFSGREPVSEFGLNPKLAPATGLFLRVWFGRLSRTDAP